MKIHRKIIADTTLDGWQNIPHICLTYEADVSRVRKMLKDYNSNSRTKVTFNTIMLRFIIEGIKASPRMNGHFHYNKWLIRGKETNGEHINVTMPMMIDNHMVAVNLRNLENKSIAQIQKQVNNIRRKSKNTNFDEALYEVSRKDTFKKLAKLQIPKTILRFLGYYMDGENKKLLKGSKKKEYYKLSASNRLTKTELDQGTITISNWGSLYPNWKGTCTLIDIVPPQKVAIGISSIRDNHVTFTIAFDHRILDTNDIIPFMKRLDTLAESPKELFTDSAYTSK